MQILSKWLIMTAMRKIACEAPERAEARFRSCCVRCHVLGTALLSALLVLPFAAWAQPAGQPASVPGAGWQTRTVQPGTTGETALQVTATLTENGPAIEQGLLWHVFQRPADGASQPTLVAQSKDASARFRLEPGDYLVNVAFGRAHLTRRISLQAGQSNLERFVLNAGGLKINAIPPFPGLHAERSIVYDVFSEERDQAGNRTRVLTGGRLDRIVRLNAGLYQVVASYGDANARVRAELAVEAGPVVLGCSHNVSSGQSGRRRRLARSGLDDT